MERIRLSKRLALIASFIPRESVLADIGSDHAHLPAYAYQQGWIKKAIAGEVREGPYRTALATVQALGIGQAISVRLGDGFQVIERGEADTIVIAGMGGELISEILERGEAKLTRETTLILQPNIREVTLRTWLDQHQWTIVDEAILEEDHHIYEVMVAKKKTAAKSAPLSLQELMMGPVLLIKKPPVFLKKWHHEENKLKKIMMSLERTSPSEAIKAKKQECEQKLDLIKKGLQ